MTFKELTRRVHINAVEKGRCKEDRAMSNTLLPCPFCGGEASLDYDFNGIGVTYGIHCPECHCAIIDTGAYSKDEAIAAWNHRAEVEPVVRGEWVKKSSEEAETLALCSKCSYPISWWHKTNYCPNCGADMRRESEVKA